MLLHRVAKFQLFLKLEITKREQSVAFCSHPTHHDGLAYKCHEVKKC